MRYERKYILTPLTAASISSFLRSNRFQEQYEQRNVNSIYYDDFNFKLFVDSERGLKKRKKIRCRFYNNEEKIVLEYKNKIDECGYKKYVDIVNQNKLLPLVSEILNKKISKFLFFPQSIELIYKPKVLISYKRRYFISSDRRLRITLDKKIKFFKTYVSENQITIYNHIPSENDVLEVKYDYSYDPSINFLNKLTNEFSLNISRFSKYCQSIKCLY